MYIVLLYILEWMEILKKKEFLNKNSERGIIVSAYMCEEEFDEPYAECMNTRN
jgi:hypothetical protein